MPIYAYKCASCGHAQDVLQKISAAPLSVCPACGVASFSKQVTAAGFQLKGSGWYVTDFRDNGKKKDSAKTAGDSATGGATEAPKPAGEAKASGEPGGETKSGGEPKSGSDSSEKTTSSTPSPSAPAPGA